MCECKWFRTSLDSFDNNGYFHIRHILCHQPKSCIRMRYALASSSWSLGIFLQQPPPIIRLCLRDCHSELLLKYSENSWILKYNRISEYTAASTNYWPFCVTYCEAFEVFWPDYFVTVNSLSIFLRYSTIISTKKLSLYIQFPNIYLNFGPKEL